MQSVGYHDSTLLCALNICKIVHDVLGFKTSWII